MKGKSLDIIKTFSEDEIKKFDLFLSSPYFNSKKSIVRLFKELRKFYPDFDSEDLTEEYLYSKVFKTGKYSYSVMKNQLSVLFQLCESFLLINKLNSSLDSSDNIISLIDEYQKRDLENLYTNRLEILRRNLSEEKYDFNYYRRKVSEIDFFLEGEFNKAAFKKTLRDSFFKKSLYELCSITNSLYRNANSIHFIALENNVKTDDNYFFIFLNSIDVEKFLRDSAKIKDNENIIPEIYIRLVKLVLHPDELDNFYRVKKIIFDSMDKFTNLERYSLLNILRNYIINNLSLAEIGSEEALSVNMKMLSSINFKQDKMESVLAVIYNGVFIQLVNSRGLKAAEKFVDEYSKQLRKEVKNDIIGYCKAIINFEKGKFETSLELLSKIKPPNIVYFVNIKKLYLKIYYELNYLDEGLSVMDTFRHFLDNDKIINEERKSLMYKSLKYFNSIYKIKLNPGKFTGYDAEKLLKDIGKNKLNFELKWMMMKVDDFIKRNK